MFLHHMSRVPGKNQKRGGAVPGPIVTEWLAAIWVLRTKHGSSVGTARSLNH